MRVYNSGAWNMIYLIWMLVARGYISWKIFESCPSKRSPSLNLSFVRRVDSLDFAQNNTSPFLVHTSPLQCKISARKTVWVYDASSFLSSNSLVSTPTAALLKVARTHSNSPFRPPTNPIRGVETLEPAPISPIRSTLISSVDLGDTLESSRGFGSCPFFQSCTTAFHESLESVKRCQPCLTRRSEPSRISWPRYRVSRAPRECSIPAEQTPRLWCPGFT